MCSSSRSRAALALLSFLTAVAPCRLSADPSPASFLEPCELGGLAEKARCGTYEVFENRDQRAGRKLPLKVVVLPATGPSRLPDPLVFFAGGPGDSVIHAAAGIAQFFAPLRAERDIVLIDVRGTGESSPLNCPELQGRAGVQSFLDDFLPTAAVERCRKQLEQDRDLTRYTSAEIVDDVAEVLAALSYGPANLVGVSYGTMAVQTYMRRHPQAVRTAVLIGVLSPDEKGPLEFARYAQASLEGWFAECAADAACAAAFPNLAQDFALVLKRLSVAPVTVEVRDPGTGQPIPVRLTRDGFGQTVRYMLYEVSTSLALPFEVHRAAAGDFLPIAETAFNLASNLAGLADGLYISVTCAEEMPLIRPEEIAPAVAGTFLGDFRIRQQRAACAVWPERKVGKETNEPLRSNVPTLLLSGERDPVTPPASAAHVASFLPQSLHVVAPDGAHGSEGLGGVECLDGLVATFIRQGSTGALNPAACIAGITRPPFLLALERPSGLSLSAAERAAYAGTYAAPDGGLRVAVKVEGEALKLEGPGLPPSIIEPVTKSRFLIVGMPPGLAIVFEFEGEAVTAMVVEEAASKFRLPKSKP